MMTMFVNMCQQVCDQQALSTVPLCIVDVAREAQALSHNDPAGFRPAGDEHMSRHARRPHTMVQHVKDQLDML